MITNQMQQSLAKEFNNPSQVEWSENKDNVMQATLQVEGQQVHAFFGNDGELICSTKPITKEQLPLKLRAAIEKKLGNVSIAAIVQTVNEDETSYYFQGVNNKSVNVWKGTANGNIEFVQKL